MYYEQKELKHFGLEILKHSKLQQLQIYILGKKMPKNDIRKTISSVEMFHTPKLYTLKV